MPVRVEASGRGAVRGLSAGAAVSTTVRFVALVRSFHAMEGLLAMPGVIVDVCGTEAIDLRVLDETAFAMRLGLGTMSVVRFVLNLWSNSFPWKCGKFDLFEALVCWDDSHTRAFQTWAAAPWRP